MQDVRRGVRQKRSVVSEDPGSGFSSQPGRRFGATCRAAGAGAVGAETCRQERFWAGCVQWFVRSWFSDGSNRRPARPPGACVVTVEAVTKAWGPATASTALIPTARPLILPSSWVGLVAGGMAGNPTRLEALVAILPACGYDYSTDIDESIKTPLSPRKLGSEAIQRAREDIARIV